MKTAKFILAGCLSAFVFLSIAAPGGASQLNSANDPTLLSFQRSLAGITEPGPSIPSPGTASERGILASDAIKGNGTRAGYVLSHCGIIPNSETVTVDGNLKARNRDYYLDTASGTIAFAEPIKTYQIVRITYRYSESADKNRALLGSPGFRLNLGSNSNMNVFYAYQAGAGGTTTNAFDLLTCGLNIETKLGNQSSMSNMLYFSSAKNSGRISLNLLGKNQSNAPAQKPKSDKLLLHNSDWKFGRLTVKPMYQEVGADFAGFTALRQQHAAPDELLNRLEKEKGLKRLGFQADYALNNNSSTNFAWNRIDDSQDSIIKQSISFASPTVKVAGSIQEIGEKFTRFKDLAEAERDQWAREKGLKRSNFALSFTPMKGLPSNSAWNTIAMTKISGNNGDFRLSTLNLALKRFSLSATDSKTDSTFTRISDISEEDKTMIALKIRQEFEPGATQANVTNEDKQHAAREVGIWRRNIRATTELGSTSASLQLLTLGDDNNGIRRQSLSFSGKTFLISGYAQKIDAGFDKLTLLAPIEKLNFANEKGMERLNIDGSFILNPSTKLRTSFSRITENNAALVKYGLDLTGNGFWIRGNLRNMDPEFTRVMDLADSDKKLMAAEQGFRRFDWAGHYESSKKLFAIDSSFINAKHATDGRFRKQSTNNLVLTPSENLKLTMFRDEANSGKNELEDRLIRNMLRLDNTLGFISLNAMIDTTRSTSASGEEKTLETRTVHFNTLPGRAIMLTGDWKNVKRNDGTFEDTQVLKLDSMLTKSLNFKGVRSIIKTDKVETIAQDYSLAGKVFNSLNLSARFGETLSNGSTTGKVRELSLAPTCPTDLGPFKSTAWSVAFAEVRKADKIETRTKSAKIETNFLQHRITAEYLGQVTKDGKTPIVRAFSLVGDPNPSKRLHYSLAYKVLDPGSAPSALVRKYNADYKLGEKSKLEYNYFSYKEQPNGTLEPIGEEHLKFTAPLTRRLGFVGAYDVFENYQQSTEKRVLSFEISGKTSSLGILEASYSYDRVSSPSGTSHARTYKLKYDYQVSPEQFITLTGQYTDWSSSQATGSPSDDFQVMLDLKTVWR
ncbi:MAG: hypothetical protein QHH26_03860 [Armatimonadota bacterium]|nr:hypothetical protein [Armatimonadota bacterium]